MAEYFQPPGQPFDFQYEDGSENLYFRNSASIATVGTGLDPLRSVLIPANTFTIDGQMMKLVSKGQATGAAGTKRVAGGINGTQNIFNTGLLAVNNQFWTVLMFISRFPGGVLYISNRITFAVSPPGGVPAADQTSVFIAGQNFEAAFTIDFFGEVSNAADSIQQDIVRITLG